MCVTANPARLTDTRTYAYATTDPDTGSSVHVVAYQNNAGPARFSDRNSKNGRPNVMFLDFPGYDMRLVKGPQYTNGIMINIMASLRPLREERLTRSPTYGSSGIAIVEDYGAYTTMRADGPANIRDALTMVPLDRRPDWDDVYPFYRWYLKKRPNRAFLLACFENGATPEHPLVVSYTPHNPDVLAVPGLDAHDGTPPNLGELINRNFKVAFSSNDLTEGHEVYYTDPEGERHWWAPERIVGFHDNKALHHANGDYAVPLSAVNEGLTGSHLADRLIPEQSGDGRRLR